MTRYLALERRWPRFGDLRQFLSLDRPDTDRVQRRLNAAHTVEDLRLIAQRRTPAGPFHYVDGGAEAEIGMHRARAAFDDLEFHPNVLRDVSTCDMSVQVLGRRSELPFGFGPTGGTRMMHAAGEKAVARAAARAGIPYALSTSGTTSIAALGSAAPDARRWFQIYLLKNRDRSLKLLADASREGYEALVLTVDVPVGGNRLRDYRTGMGYPPKLTLKTFLNASYRFEWWFNLLTTEPYRFTFQDSGNAEEKLSVKDFYDQSATFDNLEWIRDAWKGPLIIKGIQRLDDAKRAADFGADGVILSSHGGRQLDRTRPPLHLLPDVVKAVGSQLEVMLDTGIRSGADVVAAIALGAKFTFVGRAYLYGLMAGGEAGVDRVCEILQSDVRRTMQLLGVGTISELNPDHVSLLSRLSQVQPA